MKNDQQSDEVAIIRQCLEGDADAYSILVDRYKTMVNNVAYRMLGDGDTAKDIAQESFIAAYTGLGQFRFGSKFSSWLCSIVLNKCRDHLRLTKETVSTDEIADIRPDKGISPEQYASSHQSSGMLQQALDTLSPEYREVLILKHIEEPDYQEISVITGTGIAASLDGRRSMVPGAQNPQEVSVGFFHVLNADYAIRGSAFKGLNNGGPDFGMDFGIIRWF